MPPFQGLASMANNPGLRLASPWASISRAFGPALEASILWAFGLALEASILWAFGLAPGGFHIMAFRPEEARGRDGRDTRGRDARATRSGHSGKMPRVMAHVNV